MNLKVIDNFLSKSYHEKLFKILTSADFPWYFINNITQNDSSDSREFGFNHTFLVDWSFYNLWSNHLKLSLYYNKKEHLLHYLPLVYLFPSKLRSTFFSFLSYD